MIIMNLGRYVVSINKYQLKDANNNDISKVIRDYHKLKQIVIDYDSDFIHLIHRHDCLYFSSDPGSNIAVPCEDVFDFRFAPIIIKDVDGFLTIGEFENDGTFEIPDLTPENIPKIPEKEWHGLTDEDIDNLILENRALKEQVNMTDNGIFNFHMKIIQNKIERLEFAGFTRDEALKLICNHII